MKSQLNYYDNEYTEVQEMVRDNPPSTEILPHFEGYQLIGDSLFCRFANEVLNQQWKMVDGVRSVGHCVSGQRIDQLRQRIKKNLYPLTSKVIVLIGTNDVLCGGETETMIRHFKRLLKLLFKRDVKKLIILTLPPIPKFCVTFSHWSVIRTYNDFLKGLDNNFNIKVFDICPLYTKFKYALQFDITEEYPSLKKTNGSEKKTDSPLTSRSSSSSSSLERKKSPVVILERPFESPLEKKMNDLCNKLHRSRKSQLKKSTEETKIIDEIKVTEENKEIKKLTNPKVKVRKREIVEIFDSDEDMNDVNSSLKSSNGESPESPTEEKVADVEIPAVKKGTNKRTIWVADGATIDDDGNLAFNNNDDKSLNIEGGPVPKKRKITKSDPESESESLSPNRELRRKLMADPKTAQATIFAAAMKDIVSPKSSKKSPNKLPPNKNTIEKIQNLKPKANALPDKSIKVEEENGNIIATDYNWEIENCDDDEINDDIAYNSQDEAETTFNDEKSYCKTPSPESKVKEEFKFNEYLERENEEEGEDSLDLEKGEEMKNFVVTKKIDNIKKEFDEEELETKSTEDISDGEIFDDDDDDEFKQKAETDSQTSDDGTHQKQLWPKIDFPFADIVKRNLNLVATVEGTSEVVSYTNFLNQAYNFEPAQSPQPAQRAQQYSLECYSPLSTSPFNLPYKSPSPYFYNTPPNSAPPTPPPMPSPLYFAAGDSNQGKLDLEGLQPRDKNIVELSKYIVKLDSYEVLYSFGQKRLDMIHLNVQGLTELKNFLSRRIANL